MQIFNFGYLRSIKESDLRLILNWRNDEKVRKNMYNDNLISYTEHVNWWNLINSSDDKKYFIYENSGIPLGVIGFTEIDKKNFKVNWNFYSSPIAPVGTGSFMEFLALDYAFSILKINKVNCEVLAQNKSVIALHEKFGFKIEGILSDHILKNGKFHEVVLMCIKTSEWNLKKFNLELTLKKLVDRIESASENNKYR